MPRAISSDLGAAQGAVGKFNNLSKQKGQHFDLNRSNITGMKQAVNSGFIEAEQKRKYITQVIQNQAEDQDLQFRKPGKNWRMNERYF